MTLYEVYIVRRVTIDANTKENAEEKAFDEIFDKNTYKKGLFHIRAKELKSHMIA